MSDALRQQGTALENQFFQHVDAKLLEQIRTRLASAGQRESLAQVANVKDPKVLDALLALNIDAATFAAMTFVPLAMVAWADGTLDDNERAAILKGAEQHGVHAGNPGYLLLETWLQEAPAPAPAVISAWRSYVTALNKEADAATVKGIKDEILGLSENVAEASGGFLGLTPKVSAAERAKLTEIAAAFAS
jgi:hypothetical protein